ncbi:hypothetical protein EEL31_10500 [Brevibacillus laterosporus]|nr:hypothetical protein [Brevibacillus laterosporus]TPG68915.1 hypothetical protein EEL31_10500 [Brevibacillus laterosporus]
MPSITMITAILSFLANAITISIVLNNKTTARYNAIKAKHDAKKAILDKKKAELDYKIALMKYEESKKPTAGTVD